MARIGTRREPDTFVGVTSSGTGLLSTTTRGWVADRSGGGATAETPADSGPN